jgi:hypothetical protein
MSIAERNTYLVLQLNSETMNGGFGGFFSNSSGNCALVTLAACQAICPALAAVFERALSRFPGAKPSEDRRTRNDQMSAMPDEWDTWSAEESALYQLPIDPYVAEYIRRNWQLFSDPPPRVDAGSDGQ